MSWSDCVLLLPEIVLILGASALLIAPVIGKRRGEGSAKWVMIFVLAVTAATLIACSWAVEDPSFKVSRGMNAMFALDAFSIFFKLLFIAAIAMVVLLSDDFLRESRYSS
jgi:NADH:ubiquinone oxidoreductase subunit 2 (subunit N)